MQWIIGHGGGGQRVEILKWSRIQEKCELPPKFEEKMRENDWPEVDLFRAPSSVIWEAENDLDVQLNSFVGWMQFGFQQKHENHRWLIN